MPGMGGGPIRGGGGGSARKLQPPRRRRRLPGETGVPGSEPTDVKVLAPIIKKILVPIPAFPVSEPILATPVMDVIPAHTPTIEVVAVPVYDPIPVTKPIPAPLAIREITVVAIVEPLPVVIHTISEPIIMPAQVIIPKVSLPPEPEIKCAKWWIEHSPL